MFIFFFFNDTATTEIYTYLHPLSLHYALPISRSLGPATYGVRVLVLSYNRVVERILRFESWQPLIRFAVEEEARGSPRRMQRLYCYGLMLDMGAAAVAAFSAVGLAWVDRKSKGLNSSHTCASRMEYSA